MIKTGGKVGEIDEDLKVDIEMNLTFTSKSLTQNFQNNSFFPAYYSYF